MYNSVNSNRFSTREIAFCAILAALSVILARFLGIMISESVRYSFEAVPIILSGLLFGPLAGGLVGFAADTVGTLFSGYGFNPVFCVRPILYGVIAGVLRGVLKKNISIPRVFLTIMPADILGSILWQSFALAFTYSKDGAFREYLLLKLTERTIQFSIMMVLHTLLVWALLRSKIFQRMKLWPPKDKRKEE